MSTAEAEAIVGDEEDVCRLCYRARVPIHNSPYPDDIHPTTRKIRIEQISKKDLLERGFSVNVLSLYSREEALREPMRKEAGRVSNGRLPAGFELSGVLIAAVGRIHDVKDDAGNRVFRVVTDPTPTCAAHAKILMDTSLKSDYVKWRLRLREELGTLSPVSYIPYRGSRTSLVLLQIRQWFARWRVSFMSGGTGQSR